MSESTDQQEQPSNNTDVTYWNGKWVANEIAFHRPTVNK
jgi:hypothetical protein